VERGCNDFREIHSRDDVAGTGQMIRQKRVASRTASATRMREKDDRANSDRFRWTPHVAREAAVADSVERLHTPLGDSESARDKWVVHESVMIPAPRKMTLSLVHAEESGFLFARLRLRHRRRPPLPSPTASSNVFSAAYLVTIRVAAGAPWDDPFQRTLLAGPAAR